MNPFPSSRSPDGFRLLRYFTLTSLAAFAAVATALYLLERSEQTFFAEVQREQSASFARAQAELAQQQAEAARTNLLVVHEGGHVTLTRLLANALWNSDFAPFVAAASKLPIDHCRAMPADARQACFGELGRRIVALPAFATLDAKMHAIVRKSSVFKIKVYDLRGITVYSSERAQIGEDKTGNLGWSTAAKGEAASELVHRDRFSAFEGVVEDRDLIQTYVPVRVPGNDAIAGVFEIYSDVTPFLEHIYAASARATAIAAAHQSEVESVASENQRKVERSSTELLVIVAGLLGLLYVVLLVLVRNGQRIIDAQVRAHAEAVSREQRWHREKMAALATMAANVSHEVGNPLAVIAGLAQQMARAESATEAERERSRLILEQTSRIAALARHITDFASAQGESPVSVDVNRMVKAMCDFLAFDRRRRGAQIEFHPGAQLPACVAVPDHLNEALMNLLQVCTESEGANAPRRRVSIETTGRDGYVCVGITCDPLRSPAAQGAAPGDARVDSARRRLEAMGGGLSLSDRRIEISLRAAHPAA